METLGAIKVRNAIKRADASLKVELHNVRVNRALMGCAGFITDPATGRVVYLSTDHNHHTNREALVRAARDTQDYTGGHNTFAEMDADAIAVQVRMILSTGGHHYGF